MQLFPRKPVLRTLIPTLLAATVLAAPLSAESDTAATKAAPADAKAALPLEDLRSFTKIYDQIRKGYVEEVTDAQLLEYAIKGMLTELDPHSTYLDASSFDDLQVNTTGEFGGLGIEVGLEDGFVKVISPIDGTPAEKAGVEAGDLIIKLDNKPVKGMDLGDAVKQMRGPKGSELSLTIVREGADQPIELVIVRDIIQVQSVRSRVLEEGYGYLRIAQFQVHTGRDVSKAITKLHKQDPDLKGLVIDLRNNPGGVLQASVEVADAFLDDGLIVYTEGRIKNSDLRYSAKPGDESGGLPVVVLINDGSASASEIVAGALQDHRRAIIMGTASFGKGSVQTVIPITDERAIKLTTALYFTPNGRSIQAQGIKPDILVERVKVTAIKPRSQMTEADLSGHLNNANGGAESNAKGRKDKQNSDNEALYNRDNQIYEALNLLKGLHIFGQSSQGQAASLAKAAAAEVDTE